MMKWHTYYCKVRHFWLLNGFFVLLYVFEAVGLQIRQSGWDFSHHARFPYLIRNIKHITLIIRYTITGTI